MYSFLLNRPSNAFVVAPSRPLSTTFPSSEKQVLGGRQPLPSVGHGGNRRSDTRLAAAWAPLLTSAAVATVRGGTRNMAIVASGGAGDVAGILVQAYEWCINLGNPSALVAGAVIATIYETMGSGALDVEKEDSKWIKFGND